MKSRAFTLIELLVVVLIIGILSAIALPQYQTAVRKAQFVQLMTAGNALRQSQVRYRLANGNFATDFADLDIELPGTRVNALKWQGSNYTCHMAQNEGVFSYLWCTKDSLAWYWSRSMSSSRAQCYAYGGDKTAERVCASFGGAVLAENGCDGACKIYNLP